MIYEKFVHFLRHLELSICVASKRNMLSPNAWCAVNFNILKCLPPQRVRLKCRILVIFLSYERCLNVLQGLHVHSTPCICYSRINCFELDATVLVSGKTFLLHIVLYRYMLMHFVYVLRKSLLSSSLIFE